MKAIICTKYGSPDLLQIKDIEKPSPGDDEVLVKVYAASVNYNTMMFVKGVPLVGRTFTGLLKPKLQTPGNDISGRVEAVGKNVNSLKPGDEVFGDLAEYGFSAFADYVAVPEKSLTLKPANLSFEEAAAVPEAGLVALQALRDAGEIRTRNNVLIYGASGGIGTFAVQIAKYYGVEVTGVCSTINIDLVRSLGADNVIDYTREDFTNNEKQYDLILSTAGYRSILDYKRALSPGGIYISTGGTMKQIFQAMLLGPLLSMFGKKKLSSMVVKPNKDLDFMKELIETGKVKPVIDKSFSFSDTAKAISHYGEGHARGKVVITINQN